MWIFSKSAGLSLSGSFVVIIFKVIGYSEKTLDYFMDFMTDSK